MGTIRQARPGSASLASSLVQDLYGVHAYVPSVAARRKRRWQLAISLQGVSRLEPEGSEAGGFATAEDRPPLGPPRCSPDGARATGTLRIMPVETGQGRERTPNLNPNNLFASDVTAGRNPTKSFTSD